MTVNDACWKEPIIIIIVPQVTKAYVIKKYNIETSWSGNIKTTLIEYQSQLLVVLLIKVGTKKGTNKTRKISSYLMK